MDFERQNDSLSTLINVIDVETGSIKLQFHESNAEIFNHIAITNDGRTVVNFGDHVIIYDINGRFINDIPYPSSVASIDVYSADKNLLAVGTLDGTIDIRDIDTGLVLKSWQTHYTFFTSLQFDRNSGSRLLSCNSYNTVQVWDSVSGAPIGPEYKYEAFGFVDPVLSFDGNKLAFVESNEIHLVIVDTGVPATSPITYEYGQLISMNFNPNGEEIIASYSGIPMLGCLPSGEQQLDIVRWSTNNGNQIGRTFEGREGKSIGSSNDMWFSNVTNNLAVSTCSNSTGILIWDWNTALIKHYVSPSAESWGDQSRISTNGQTLVVATQIYSENIRNEKKHESPSQFNSLDSFTQRSRAISSDLDEITNTVLESVVEPAPVCAGISEWNIADGIVLGLQNKRNVRYQVPGYPNLLLGITPSHMQPLEVLIDQGLEKIRINLPLYIDIYAKEDDNNSSYRISRTRASFTILAEPSIVVSRRNVAQRLQLDFDGSTLNSNSGTVIFDLAVILGEFGNDTNLNQFIEETINTLVNGTEPGIALYFSALIMDATLPDSWNRAREYVLLFLGFSFKSVTVKIGGNSEDVGYIFPIFSLLSLNQPPRCVCKENLNIVNPHNLVSQPDPRRWCSLAFSEDALNEIANPHRSSGDRSGTSSGGSLYWEVDSYFSSEIKEIQIKDDKIIAPVDIIAGGHFSAGLRGKILGHKFNIIRQTVGLDISVEDVQTEWNFDIISDFTKTGVTSAVLSPKVIIEPENVHVKPDTGLDDRLDQALGWAIDWFLSFYVSLISLAVQNVAFMEFIYDIYNNEGHDFHISNAESSLFDRSSLVITVELQLCACDSEANCGDNVSV